MKRPLNIPPKEGRRWDLVALGEVMLRLDPGEGRIHTARTFRAWEGGGEYNVARGLKRCFGLDTALVSAFADNPVGRLVQDLIFQGGVDQSHVRWVKYDGVGRESRNGLNFVERGFGIRAGIGCSDRGHTAVSQLAPGDIDWASVADQAVTTVLYMPRRTLDEFARKAMAKGLDPATPAIAIASASLPEESHVAGIVAEIGALAEGLPAGAPVTVVIGWVGRRYVRANPAVVPFRRAAAS